jgi:hypothetical protein
LFHELEISNAFFEKLGMRGRVKIICSGRDLFY